jgi:hypothetical protein
MSDRQLRLFTLEQATRLLPVLAHRLEALRTQVQEVRTCRAELERLAGRPHQGNGSRAADETKAGELRGRLEELARSVQDGVREVESYGCEVKDVEIGLIDFRSLRNGRVVYLCWRLGVPAIEHWHELDTGFAGRQPL